MYKTTARHSKRLHHAAHDLYGDLAKIKDALANATYGVKSRTGEAISQSFDDMREKFDDVREKSAAIVTDKPLKSIGVALLAGIFVGYFMHK